MKQIITLVFLVFIGLSSSHANNKVETILFECMKKSFMEQGVDLEQELLKIELHLINNGILESSSGQSYYDFCKYIEATGKLPKPIKADVFTNIKKIKPGQYYPDGCMEGFTKDELINSKFFKMAMKMVEVQMIEDSLKSVASVTISVLTASDLNIPYHKVMTLLAIVNHEAN